MSAPVSRRWQVLPQTAACGWAGCPDPSLHTHVHTYSHVYDGQPAGDIHQITLRLTLACGADGPGALGSSDPAEVTCAECELAGAS